MGLLCVCSFQSIDQSTPHAVTISDGKIFDGPSPTAVRFCIPNIKMCCDVQGLLGVHEGFYLVSIKNQEVA